MADRDTSARGEQTSTSTSEHASSGARDGAGGFSTESAPPRPSPTGVEELTTAECWRLVESSTLGRLAVNAPDGGPDVFPLNFLARHGNLFIRSAAGKKLRSIARNPVVALEVDGADDQFYWSVVVRGKAERMEADADVRASGVRGLTSQNPTPKHEFIRLTPSTITGRRFPKDSPLPSTAASEARVAAGEGEPSGPLDIPNPARVAQEVKPTRIPHLPPRRQRP